MKKMMLTIVLLTFFSFWMLPADSRMIKPPHSSNAIPLSMMEESVDDMYDGCLKQMKNKVDKTYLPKELEDKVFRAVWNGKSVNKCVDKGKKEQARSNTKLSPEQIRAICTYTAGGPHDLYKAFNIAVMDGKNTYTTSFKYHALHFYLTEAIQALQKGQGGSCLTTYRRTKEDFTGQPKQLIRFGSFASSSKNPNMGHFGRKTCFVIDTCYGAYLEKYPTLGDKEQEVLIPPYEVFEIVKMQKEEMEEMRETMDCDKVFTLKTKAEKSKLNCKAA